MKARGRRLMFAAGATGVGLILIVGMRGLPAPGARPRRAGGRSATC